MELLREVDGPPMLPDQPLDKLLDWCITYLHWVSALKGTTEPLFIAVDSTGQSWMYLARWESSDDKDAAVTHIKRLLWERQAVKYAFITESWTIELPSNLSPETTHAIIEVISRRGTDAFPSLRKEAFMVLACDRDTTLSAQLMIERDAEGGIAKLHRHPQKMDSNNMTGRFVNLLATTH
jgi:hypothetical protein